jgi:SOS-response transcriptional repressor LexA
MKHQPAITGRALGYRCFQVLNYINSTVASDGIAPSYDMICDELGISSKAKVSDIITRLERRGLVSRVGGGRCPSDVHARRIRRIALLG